VTGGHGATTPAGGFDPAVDIAWVSTEHNIDAWHTLTLAQTVLADATAGATADRLADAVVRVLWDGQAGHFLQGWGPGGADHAEALDVNSWGAVFLAPVGHPDLARLALEHTATFAAAQPPVSGFGPVPPSGVPLVWFEGSAGVALAQVRLGEQEEAAATLSGLMPGALPNGAFPGATNDEEDLGMTTAPSVGATTWVLLSWQALAGRPAIWDDQPVQGASN